MEDVLIKVAAFAAIIAAGYFARRSGMLGAQPETTIPKIVFNFTLPCAIIHAFGAADFTPDLLLLVPLGFVCAIVPFFVTVLLTRTTEQRDRVFYLLNSCGFNIGCFALPFVQSLFSPTMAVATCLFDAGNAIMMTGGSYALTGLIAGGKKIDHPVRFVLRRLLSSVPFDAYMVLIVLAVLEIHLPDEVVKFTEPIANANSFLALFMLGLMIRFTADRKQIREIAQLAGIRIVAAAVFTALEFAFLPFGFTSKVVIAILLWAPSSALGPVFTLRSGGDFGLAGLASGFTIILGVCAATTISIVSGVAGV